MNPYENEKATASNPHALHKNKTTQKSNLKFHNRILWPWQIAEPNGGVNLGNPPPTQKHKNVHISIFKENLINLSQMKTCLLGC